MYILDHHRYTYLGRLIILILQFQPEHLEYQNCTYIASSLIHQLPLCYPQQSDQLPVNINSVFLGKNIHLETILWLDRLKLGNLLLEMIQKTPWDLHSLLYYRIRCCLDTLNDRHFAKLGEGDSKMIFIFPKFT